MHGKKNEEMKTTPTRKRLFTKEGGAVKEKVGSPSPTRTFALQSTTRQRVYIYASTLPPGKSRVPRVLSFPPTSKVDTEVTAERYEKLREERRRKVEPGKQKGRKKRINFGMK